MTNRVPNPEDETDLQFLVDWLVGYRKTLGLSQREVARRMGASNSSVHYLEIRSKEPSIPMLQAYCRALGGTLNIGFVLSASPALKPAQYDGDPDDWTELRPYERVLGEDETHD